MENKDELKKKLFATQLLANYKNLDENQKRMEELREELSPLATKRVSRSLALGKFSEEEKIEVTDADIDAEIERIKESATENKDALAQVLGTLQARESIEQTLISRKTVDRLVEIAKGSPETKIEKQKEEK